MYVIALIYYDLIHYIMSSHISIMMIHFYTNSADTLFISFTFHIACVDGDHDLLFKSVELFSLMCVMQL